MKIKNEIMNNILEAMSLFYKRRNFYALLPIKFIHPYFLLHPDYAKFIDELWTAVYSSNTCKLKHELLSILDKYEIKTKEDGRYPMPYLEQDEIQGLAIKTIESHSK